MDSVIYQKKLNILLINRWVGYNEGGNEAHIQGLLVWLAKKGHTVSVITAQGDKLEKLKDLDKSKVKLFYIKSPTEYLTYNNSGIIHAALFLIRAFFKVVKLRNEGEKFDLVSVHFSLEALLARVLKIFFGYPYIMILAGDTYLEILEGKRADGTVHITNFMNQQSIKMGYSAKIIPKGFDLDIFHPNYDVSDLAVIHKNKPEDKILLTVCRLDPRKNLITMVEAMDIIVNQRKIQGIKWLIIGDGIERQFLENSVTRYGLTSNISFLGSMSNKTPELAKYYVLADLFVLPTLYEGFGWVFYEAMACGTPVITTTAGSNPEVVGETGVLVEPKSPEKLADAILSTLKDQKLMNDLQKKGFKKATGIPWEKQIVKYERYMMELNSKKCSSISCKLIVVGYMIIDSFSIFKYFIKNRAQTKGWDGRGQSGLN